MGKDLLKTLFVNIRWLINHLIRLSNQHFFKQEVILIHHSFRSEKKNKLIRSLKKINKFQEEQLLSPEVVLRFNNLILKRTKILVFTDFHK